MSRNGFTPLSVRDVDYRQQVIEKLISLSQVPNVADFSLDIRDILTRAARILRQETNGTVSRKD